MTQCRKVYELSLNQVRLRQRMMLSVIIRNGGLSTVILYSLNYHSYGPNIFVYSEQNFLYLGTIREKLLQMRHIKVRVQLLRDISDNFKWRKIA